MSVEKKCPFCGAVLNLPDDLNPAEDVTCYKCHRSFRAQPHAAKPAKPGAGKSPEPHGKKDGRKLWMFFFWLVWGVLMAIISGIVASFFW